MADRLESVEVLTSETPVGSVVWLHGLGADGRDFEPIVPLLGLPDVRFVFPHAPLRPVTINAGTVMRAWYDILEMDGDVEDIVGIRESARLVEAFLEREQQRGLAASRIVLAGFSQGGAMALHVGTRHPKPLLGIAVLSGYEVLADAREAEQSPANRATPLLACHGTMDGVVDIARGRRAYEAHAHAGRPAEWHEFPIGHEVSPEEVRVIARWLHERFRGPQSGSR